MATQLATFLRTAGIVFVLGTPVVVQRNFGPRPEDMFSPLSFTPPELSEQEQRIASEVTTEDAQAYDQLWIQLKQLHEDDSVRSAKDFVGRAVSVTAAFLKLEAEDEIKFIDSLEDSLAELDQARQTMTGASDDDRQASWAKYQKAQAKTVERFAKKTPLSTARAVLLTNEADRWLLQLDFGRRAAERKQNAALTALED